jgi:hypothetical protein
MMTLWLIVIRKQQRAQKCCCATERRKKQGVNYIKKQDVSDCSARGTRKRRAATRTVIRAHIPTRHISARDVAGCGSEQQRGYKKAPLESRAPSVPPSKLKRNGNEPSGNANATLNSKKNQAHDRIQGRISNQATSLFKQSGHLVLHLRVHTAERPFRCLRCGTYGLEAVRVAAPVALASVTPAARGHTPARDLKVSVA